MGSFFKNIINDSRSGIPSGAHKAVSSFADTLSERQYPHMPADFPVFGIAGIEAETTSESNSVRSQSQAKISTSAEVGDAFSTQKVQLDTSRAADDRTASEIRHEQQALAPQQSANGSEHTDIIDGDERRPDLKDTLFDNQTENHINSTQSKPVAAQKLISDDCIADEKNLAGLKNDQQTSGPLFESVRKPEQSVTQSAQHKMNHVALDQPVLSEPELTALDSGIGSDTGSGMNLKNKDRVDAYRPHNEEAIKHAAVQNGQDASKPSMVVVNNEMRIEARAARTATVESRKDTYPQVSIGLVNVIVEGPKITQGKQVTLSNSRRDDQDSRHYLRSL